MARCFECDDENATVLPGTEGWFLYCNRCRQGWTVDSRGVRQTPRRSAERAVDDASTVDGNAIGSNTREPG